MLDSFSREVLAEIDEILVIDNCSTDDTREVLRDRLSKRLASGTILTCIFNRENYGLGGSLKIAFRYFLKRDYSHIMIVHGDNQGDGDVIAKRFLDCLQNDPEVEFIAASRFLSASDLSKYSPMRILGNRVFNTLTRMLAGVPISDSGTGIVCIRSKVLRQLPYSKLQSRLHFNPQLNILLYGDTKVRISEVPLCWRDADVESHMRPLPYCLELLWILLQYRIKKSLLLQSDEQIFAESEEFTPRFEVLRCAPVPVELNQALTPNAVLRR